ncbi:MAG TPA: hypothetical protein VHX59_04285 [Mycobacteriales bacterium]|nr:hypothetical protein [Mycobacteriales bacterium]
MDRHLTIADEYLDFPGSYVSHMRDDGFRAGTRLQGSGAGRTGPCHHRRTGSRSDHAGADSGSTQHSAARHAFRSLWFLSCPMTRHGRPPDH